MIEPLDSQVEASRRALRALLSRRDFLTAAGVAAVGVAGLAGCASSPDTTSGSGGGIPAGLQPITGSVSLPPGSTLKVTDLSVDILTQTVPVSGSGSFAIGIASSGPSLALLLDASGNGVLMSMFDPALPAHAISSHTTAVALLYYGLSGYSFSAASTSKILSLLDADPAVAGLESAIATAVAADPSALANNAAPIGPAVVRAVHTIMGTSTSVKSVTAAAHLEDPVPTLLLVSPTDAQSGVTVDQAPDTSALLISNAKRRPCRVYIYETATVTAGTPVPTDPPVRFAGPLDMNPTQALNLINALSDFTTFHNGVSPWSPVNLPAVPLTLHTGTDRTEYTVVTLMASWKDLQSETFEPQIFRAPRWAGEVAGWRIDNNNLFQVCFFGSLVLPVLCLFLGAGALDASYAVVAQVVLTAAAAGSATFTRIINQLEYGSVGQLKAGLAAVVRDAITSDTSTQFWKDEVQQVVKAAESRALAAETAAAAGTRMSRAARMFTQIFEPLFAVGAALELLDYGAVIADLWNSDLADTWTALLIRQLLNLSPQSPTVSPSERITFKVSNPANAPNGTFQYDWTQSSPFATLSAQGEANVGQSVTTSKLIVDLITTGSDATPINLLVIGYDTSSGQRIEIGRAGTTVKFLLPAQILPANAAVEIHDQRLFSVTVGGTPPSGIKYRWTLTGTSGAIGDTNVVNTTLPQVNYTALQQGSDTLHVDVLDLGNNVVAKADATITVPAGPSITFTVAGSWADPGPRNGTFTFTDQVGGRLPGNATTDAILLSYDTREVSPGEYASGVDVVFAIPTGAPLITGEVFTKEAQGEPIRSGLFQLIVAHDLGDPVNSIALPAGSFGSLKIDSVSQLLDGTFVAAYTFNTNNGAGGTVVGSGVGRWK